MKQDKNIPQGYKDSPLGIIPQEWEVKRLGDIAKIMTGSTPPTSDVANYGTDYLFVSPTDLGEKKYIQNAEKKLSEKGFSLSRQFPKGTILFVCIGSTIGKLGIATELLTSNQQINAITCDNVISFNEYVFYSLTQKARKIKLIAGEQAVPIINKSSFENVKIPLPPLPEQQKIAEILTCWDAAIEKQTQLIEKLETRKRGLMQQLLTGKKRLKGFEGKWKKKGAGEIFKSISIKGFSNEDLLSATQDKGMIPRSLLEGRVTMPTSGTESFKLVEKGDFVISLRSFQGGLEYSYHRGLVSPAYTVLKSKIAINDEFYRQYFKSYDFIGHLAIAVVGIRDGKQISYDDFCTVKIPRIAIEEQTAIAHVLLEADEEIEKGKEKLAAFKSQKKGLMQVLLTGKKRVKI